MGNLWTKTIPISSRFLGTSIISSLLRVKYSREQFIIIIIIWNGYYWMGHAVLLGDFGSIQSCWRNLVYDGVFFLDHIQAYHILSLYPFLENKLQRQKLPLMSELSSNWYLYLPRYKLFHNTYSHPLLRAFMHSFIQYIHSFYIKRP